MRLPALPFTLFLLTLLACAPARADDVCTLDRATGSTIEKQPFMTGGYGLRWNIATNKIAYMETGDDGHYHLMVMNPDGSGRTRLGNSPGLHEGAPYWHPSGRYLMFIAQKPGYKSRKLFGAPDYDALPGFGRHDDLWLTTPDGSKRWQLTNEPNTKDEGILLPAFSPDGAHIAWSQRQEGSGSSLKYVLRVADFIEKPQPHLGNIRDYAPGGVTYYEPGGFTSDSKGLAYTSDQDTHNFWQGQIYMLNLATGEGTRLTHDKAYNEHPNVIRTPAGDRVVYMSTKDVDRRGFSLMLGTDWYVMNTDGSNAWRLTTMNKKGRNNPEDMGAAQVACTVAISPRGDYLLGDVQDSITKQTGLVRTVHFTCQKPQ